jgi:heme oxygenase
MFSSLNSPLGGLLGDASIMDLGFGASNVLSGIQSIRQGNIMKNQYELQALQTLTEMERQQYNATVEGAARLDKLQRIQSANLAKNYARGVGGLSGSALLNQIISDQEYGKDYKMELYNIANIGSTGKVNADIYKASAKAAPIDAALDAGIKLGEAAYSYKKLYG